LARFYLGVTHHLPISFLGILGNRHAEMFMTIVTVLLSASLLQCCCQHCPVTWPASPT
jgi:hypothetical protein